MIGWVHHQLNQVVLRTELYASRFNRIFPEIPEINENEIQSMYNPLPDNAKQKKLFLVG